MRFHLPLTPREMDVLRLMAHGFDNQSIATQLGVSHASIEKHSARIFRKLDVRSAPGRNARVMATLRFHGIQPAMEGAGSAG